MRYFIPSIVTVLMLATCAPHTPHSGSGENTIPSEAVNRAMNEVGLGALERRLARDRVEKFELLLKSQPNTKEINQFFNRHIHYIAEEEGAIKKDRWQGLLETLVRGTGDCEDYAIAKYAALRLTGTSDRKLRIVYGIIKRPWTEQAHMVLLVKKRRSFLVLDNLQAPIQKLSERRDLSLVYGFNGRSYWRISDNYWQKLTSADTIKLWRKTKSKMKSELGILFDSEY